MGIIYITHREGRAGSCSRVNVIVVNESRDRSCLNSVGESRCVRVIYLLREPFRESSMRQRNVGVGFRNRMIQVNNMIL